MAQNNPASQNSELGQSQAASNPNYEIGKDTALLLQQPAWWNKLSWTKIALGATAVSYVTYKIYEMLSPSEEELVGNYNGTMPGNYTVYDSGLNAGQNESLVPECLWPLFQKYGTEVILHLVEDLKQIYSYYGRTPSDVYNSMKMHEMQDLVPQAHGFQPNTYTLSVLRWSKENIESGDLRNIIDGLRALAAESVSIPHANLDYLTGPGALVTYPCTYGDDAFSRAHIAYDNGFMVAVDILKAVKACQLDIELSGLGVCNAQEILE